MSSTELKNSKDKLKKRGNWKIGSKPYKTYSEFKHNYAGMVCGILQKEIEKLQLFTKSGTATGTDRAFLETTLKDLEKNVNYAFTSPDWKDKEEKSKSRNYLQKVSEGFNAFTQSVDDYQTNPQLAVKNIDTAADTCIGTKPPSRLRGSFVTIELEQETAVPGLGGQGNEKIKKNCTVASLIKEIGEIMKEKKFIEKVSKCYTGTTLMNDCDNNNNDINTEEI